MAKGKATSLETIRNLAKIKPHIGTATPKEISRITGVPTSKISYLLKRYPTGDLTKAQRDSATKFSRGGKMILPKMAGRNYQPLEKEADLPYKPDLKREPGVVYWGDLPDHYFFEPGKKSSKNSTE